MGRGERALCLLQRAGSALIPFAGGNTDPPTRQGTVTGLNWGWDLVQFLVETAVETGEVAFLEA